MTVEVVYETHSVTTDNEAGFATGWLPGRLSERGRALAAELGERRRHDNISAVFVSDLGRAVETAEIAFGGSGLPIHREVRLRECNYGELNGAPVAQVAAERARHIGDPYPGGQSYVQIVALTRSLLRDLAAYWDGKRVLLIARSANRWALERLLHGRSLEELVDAPFEWQPGWCYRLPVGWTGEQPS